MSEDPNERAKRIAKLLHPYCTILLKLYVDEVGQKRALQIGSGTYIRKGELFGILTAQHCVELLVGDYLLGLNAAPEANEHNFTLHPNHIQITEIARPISEEWGPDLAFITIADWGKLSTIRASKSFFDVQNVKEYMLGEAPTISQCLWYVCGAPNERLVTGISMAGFDEMLEFQELCGAGGIDRLNEMNGYDYGDMFIIPSAEDPPPSTFGGMSGGGLWQVPWPPSNGLSDSMPEFLFAGVIFYQGTLEDQTRFIRCHFRKSVYQHVIDALP